MTYCSITDILTWGRFTEADFGAAGYNYPSTLEQLLWMAERAIDDYCDQPAWFFEPDGVSITRELHDGVEIGQYGLYPSFGLYSVKRRPFLRLQYTPVLRVTALEEETSGGSWTARTEGRDHDFLVQRDGVRFVRNVPAYDYANVRVTYMAGYAETPGRVKECTVRLAAAMGHAILDARVRSPSGVGDLNVSPTETAGFTSALFTGDLKGLVKKFRRRVPVRVVP